MMINRNWNFLEASLKDKIKLYLISKVTVAIMDLFLWSVLYAILPIVKELDFMEFNFGLDVFWIVITIALYRYRKKINEYFITLSVGWIVFFFALLLGMGLMAGCIQYVLYEDSSSKLIQIALVIQNVLTLLIAGGCVAFSYHIISKRNVQLLLEQEQEKYLIQSKMYSSKVKQNEDIRKFRHDMEKHMKIIRQLCDDIPNPDSKVEKLIEYIDKYLEKSPKQIIVQTGHMFGLFR